MQFIPDIDVYPNDQLVRTGSIEDGEVLYTTDYQDVGNPFKVIGVRAVFYSREGGVWGCRHVTVRGLRLKQDGTVGKVPAERSFTVGHQHTPEWVERIVQYLQPTVPAPVMVASPLPLD